MEIITLLVASISFVVVIVTTVVYARRSIDMKKNLDYQIMDVRKNVNDVTAENYKYDMKQQKDLELTNSNLDDVKTSYAKKAELASKITTESLEAANLIAGNTTFKNIGAAFDNTYNNNPTMSFTKGPEFTLKGSSPEFTVRSSGDFSADRNVISGKGLMGKSLDIQGSTPGTWGGLIRNGGVMAEVANAAGHGLRVKTDNEEATKYGLNVENKTGSSFLVGNDGSQNLKYSSATNPGWSMYGPKGNVLIGAGDNGIIVNTNNTNGNASGLQVYNGSSVVLNAGNDGVVNIPGSTRTSSLRVNNANGTSTIFGENNTNTITGETTFGSTLMVKNADSSMSSFGMTGTPIPNTIQGRTNVNNVMFTDDWYNYPDSGVGRAEISSDMGNHKSLVIGGVRPSTSSTDKRKVKVMDDLSVTNDFNVMGKSFLAGTLDVADNTTLRGNLTAKNIRNNLTSSTDRLDITGTRDNGSALFNGLLFDSVSGGLGIQPVNQPSPSQKVPAGEVRVMVRGSPVEAPVYTKLNASADGKHYFEGPGSVFKSPMDVEGNLNVNGEEMRVMVRGSPAAAPVYTKLNAAPDGKHYFEGPGSVFKSQVDVEGNVNVNGTTRTSSMQLTDNLMLSGFDQGGDSFMFLSNPNSSGLSGGMLGTSLYARDVIYSGNRIGAGDAAGNFMTYMDSTGEIVANKKVTVKNTAGGDMMCLNTSCLTEADIAKIKALP